MAYATTAEVEAEFKDIEFTSDTPVKPADVSSFISQADAIINAHLSGQYIVPVTADSDTLLVLKAISIAIVRERIAKILGVKSGVDALDQNNQTKGSDQDLNPWIMLKKIQNGSMKLTADLLLAAGDGVSSYAVSAGLKHTFKKGVDQW